MIAVEPPMRRPSSSRIGVVLHRPRVSARDGDVIAGHERAALVLDALQVERPSRLLVVVRDPDVPQDRAGLHLHLPKRLVPSASARGVVGTDRPG
jgi:hypothetical protein